MENEYNDIHYINAFCILCNVSNIQPEGDSIVKFNEKFFNYTKQNIDITNMLCMKDIIKNYRTLTNIQLIQLDTLTEVEKIEIIKTYNIMISYIENLL